MGYASKAGRAIASSTNPRAQAVCQRCGIWYNRDQLSNQTQWRGAALLPLNLYVCQNCLDRPQEQLRSIVVPADPIPIYWPLTEPFSYDEGGNSPVYGQPTGLIQDAVQPYNGAIQKAYRVPIQLLSVTSNGSNTITVTCSSPHNLVTADPYSNQIAVEGLAVNGADGFYSVTVTGAMSFTYTTYSLIPGGSLLTSTTLMITCYVGLPYNTPTIPQVGPVPGGVPYGVWDESFWNESIWG